MENNTEEKKRFYNQYIGQYVLSLPHLVYINNPPEPSHEEYGEDMLTYQNIEKVMQYNFPLWLTSLESITDEHAIEVAKMCYKDTTQTKKEVLIRWGKEVSEEIGKYQNLSWDFMNYYTIIPCVDFLRKNSYAVPFDGKPVEELISRGWVKIKEQ